MGVVAAVFVAIGSVLLLIGLVSAVALCRQALRHGAEIKAEVKAPSLVFKVHLRPGRPDRERTE
jgi:hypothetical protein